jgi:manganese/iron transport system substrate-binding protein
MMSRIIQWLFVLLFAASGCRPAGAPLPPTAEPEVEHGVDEIAALSPVALAAGEKLRVVATTSIVADVVKNVGQGLIDLTLLVPLGTDPHAFEPTPQDVVALADSHVVFANGAGLEAFLEPLLETAVEDAIIVPLSRNIELLQFADAQEGAQDEGGPGPAGFDPHTWFDPNNVVVWTRNIGDALSALDPLNAAAYQANAEAYEQNLEELDEWIRAQLAQVPKADRRVVTDHRSFSYFASRYGFEQIGAVFSGYSTLDEPSARDIAALEDAIRQFEVKAVFVGLTVNSRLAERVAEDTDTKLVFFYTGSLSEPGGPASDYVSFMRYNVTAIAEALR